MCFAKCLALLFFESLVLFALLRLHFRARFYARRKADSGFCLQARRCCGRVRGGLAISSSFCQPAQCSPLASSSSSTRSLGPAGVGEFLLVRSGPAVRDRPVTHEMPRTRK